MKKKMAIFSSIGVLLIAAGSYVFFTSSVPKPNLGNKTKAHESNSVEQLKTLEVLGFVNADNLNKGDTYDFAVNPDAVKFYREKYGVEYLSAIGMQKYAKEYNIITGPVGNFTGSIPAKNINEMNVNIQKFLGSEPASLYYVNNSLMPGKPLAYIPKSFLTPLAIRTCRQIADGLDVETEFYGAVQEKYRYLYPREKYTEYAFLHIANKFGDVSLKPTLLVAAPDFDFDKAGMEVKDGELVKKKPVDPMVLMVTNDGYVVLTKWID